MEPTLVANSMVGSIASGFFLSVALRLRSQRVSDDAGQAITLFALWWMALAVYAVVGASTDLLAAVGVERFEIAIAFHFMQMIALCIGLWGLMYYLAYILTGHRKLMTPLALFYAGYYAVILFMVTLGRPIGVAVESWTTRMEYAAPLLTGLGIAMLLVVPPVVAAGTYVVIYFQTESPTHRFRVAALAAATLAWCASLVFREATWIDALPAVMAILSAFMVNWAYDPPKFLRAKLAV